MNSGSSLVCDSATATGEHENVLPDNKGLENVPPENIGLENASLGNEEPFTNE